MLIGWSEAGVGRDNKLWFGRNKQIQVMFNQNNGYNSADSDWNFARCWDFFVLAVVVARRHAGCMYFSFLLRFTWLLEEESLGPPTLFSDYVSSEAES